MSPYQNLNLEKLKDIILWNNLVLCHHYFITEEEYYTMATHLAVSFATDKPLLDHHNF